MKTVDEHEAKTHTGKPLARLVSIEKKGKKRKPGTAKRKIVLSESFGEPLPEDMLDLLPPTR